MGIRGAVLSTVLIVVGACSATAPPGVVTSAMPAGSSPPRSTPTASDRHTALADLLAMIVIAPEHRDGYKRSLFIHWIDADGDGCDTRDEVLLSQAALLPFIRGNCAISGGEWFSEYDGRTFDGPAEVEVDHVVALGEAWASGASGWSMARRQDYANDLGVPWALIAVSSGTNESKGDRDPASWLPPRTGELCPYLASWIGVKVRWRLTMDQRERDAVARQITGCPYTRLDVPIAP
jgi:uncharacterized protein DUF1524